MEYMYTHLDREMADGVAVVVVVYTLSVDEANVCESVVCVYFTVFFFFFFFYTINIYIYIYFIITYLNRTQYTHFHSKFIASRS